jgi:hypothetical protein
MRHFVSAGRFKQMNVVTATGWRTEKSAIEIDLSGWRNDNEIGMMLSVIN